MGLRFEIKKMSNTRINSNINNDANVLKHYLIEIDLKKNIWPSESREREFSVHFSNFRKGEGIQSQTREISFCFQIFQKGRENANRPMMSRVKAIVSEDHASCLRCAVLSVYKCGTHTGQLTARRTKERLS